MSPAAAKRTVKHPLPEVAEAIDFAWVELDADGLVVERSAKNPEKRTPVAVDELPAFLSRRLRVPPGTTDVFVWVHGWRNDMESAGRAAQRLFAGVQRRWAERKSVYTRLTTFKPFFVAVHWPSMSSPFLSGYRSIRDRAHAMTEEGVAEYVLASLLGYLDEQRGVSAAVPPSMLKAKAGYYVHAVGHSFGGRFLCQAIAAAASPSPGAKALLARTPRSARVLSARTAGAGFDYTVDTLLVFQMAAPRDIFSGALRALVEKAPLTGPVCLTYSSHDRATCGWHKVAEGAEGIGCAGASEPAKEITSLALRAVDARYGSVELLEKRILNVECSRYFDDSAFYSVSGAHSDFFYEESVHLLLSLVDVSRVASGDGR